MTQLALLTQPLRVDPSGEGPRPEGPRPGRASDQPLRPGGEPERPRLVALTGGGEVSVPAARYAPVPAPGVRAAVAPTPVARGAVTPAGEVAPVPAPAGRAATGPTLDTVLSAAFAAVTAGAPAACPICDGRMEPRWSAGAGSVGGRCTDCGTTLD